MFLINSYSRQPFYPLAEISRGAGRWATWCVYERSCHLSIWTEWLYSHNKDKSYISNYALLIYKLFFSYTSIPKKKISGLICVR